jgi:hypothetical protein
MRTHRNGPVREVLIWSVNIVLAPGFSPRLPVRVCVVAPAVAQSTVLLVVEFKQFERIQLC